MPIEAFDPLEFADTLRVATPLRRCPRIELSGAVVIVTGAARGIGLATAQLFHERGATVHLGDIDVELAEDAAREIGSRCRRPPRLRFSDAQ